MTAARILYSIMKLHNTYSPKNEFKKQISFFFNTFSPVCIKLTHSALNVQPRASHFDTRFNPGKKWQNPPLAQTR